MYLFDPTAGRRRRALARDKVVRYAKEFMVARHAAQKQLENRAQGVVAETRSRFQQEPISDEILVARVRAEMGHVVSHSPAIEVHVEQGRITLRGSIVASEMDPLLKAVRAVPGVKEVDNQLQTYEQPGAAHDMQSSSPGSGTGST
jgi:osmotically-inducible protein OsmY